MHCLAGCLFKSRNNKWFKLRCEKYAVWINEGKNIRKNRNWFSKAPSLWFCPKLNIASKYVNLRFEMHCLEDFTAKFRKKEVFQFRRLKNKLCLIIFNFLLLFLYLFILLLLTRFHLIFYCTFLYFIISFFFFFFISFFHFFY